MSLEFIVEEECNFKSKYENDLLYVLDLMQKNYIINNLPKELLRDKSTQIKVNENKAFSIKEIEESLQANNHCKECKSCSANSSGLDYGCYNRISYPISRSFEEYITNNIPENGSFALKILLDALKDFPLVDIKGLKRFRKRGFTELKNPIEVLLKKESLFKKVKISSDFYIHLLLFSGDLLEVSHISVILLFWGIIPHSTKAEDFGNREYIVNKIKDFLNKRNLEALPNIH